MHDVTNQGRLRANIASGHQTADDYLELASALFEAARFEESVAILRQGIEGPFTGVARARLLTSLGWYVNAVTQDRNEPRSLAREAAALTDGIDTGDALIANAKSKTLLAECSWVDDRVRAEDAATSAIGLFERIQISGCLLEKIERYEVLLESARLHRLLGHFEQSIALCQQAIEIASNRNDQLSAQIELGTTYRNAGRLSEARQAFRTAVASASPPFGLVRAYFELGLVENDLGRTGEGRAKVRKAIEILESDARLPRADLPEFLRVYGYMSYDLGDLESAAGALKAAADSYPLTDPFHWSSLLWLARCQFDLGEHELARANAKLVSHSPVATDEDRADADHLLASM